MIVCRTKQEVFSLINESNRLKQALGLVPTMGSLHRGHLSLISEALQHNDIVWVTIFVNPTQFNNKEDLTNYPKNLENDLKLIKKISNSINVFHPSETEIYDGKPFLKKYDFNRLDLELEGKFRADHFNGVATIVAKLFKLFKPSNAYFGEKDYQQTQIINRLIDLEKIDLKVIICPTIREENGLALSSRNKLLSIKNKNKSSIIYKNLVFLQKSFNKNRNKLNLEKIKSEINFVDDFKIEYLEIVNNKSLQIELKFKENESYRAFICVNVNGVRLIDNILLN
ncbi:MAG: pantoate--beta-alanine ligase [Flavobacteriaceae bacterium]|jgi:pantoate--beta-alanine ligase|tara:strand:- start:5700 stop:6548 length:849 start_codon:yes stop_codon:yes gene_type:complete